MSSRESEHRASASPGQDRQPRAAEGDSHIEGGHHRLQSTAEQLSFRPPTTNQLLQPSSSPPLDIEPQPSHPNHHRSVDSHPSYRQQLRLEHYPAFSNVGPNAFSHLPVNGHASYPGASSSSPPSMTLSAADLGQVEEKILHFTSTLAGAAAAAAGADGKKEPNIDDLQRKLHFYQVMLWLKRSYRIGGETSLTKRCVYQDYSNMCTDSGMPSLFSPSVFGKVIKRTFPDLKYRRRRINRRINAHYEGLERVRECFDSSGHPRSLPIKQEELEEAERMRLEFQDKKIGGRQTRQEKRTVSSSDSSPQTTKRRRKNGIKSASADTKIKQETLDRGGRRRKAADDDEYLPEDERRSDSDEDGSGSGSSSSGASQHPHEDAVVAGGQTGPSEHFWRDWTFPMEPPYAGGDMVRYERGAGGAPGFHRPGGIPPVMEEYGPVDGVSETSFQFVSYLESGHASTSSFSSSFPSSSSSTSAWRQLPGQHLPPPPSHYMLPSLPSPIAPFPPLQHRLLPSPPAFGAPGMGQMVPPHSSLANTATTSRSSSGSSPARSSSPGPLMQSFPLPSTSPSASSTSFPSSSFANHPCPCPSCVSPRQGYFSAQFH